MAMEPRSLTIPRAPRPMGSHYHGGGERGYSENPRVHSPHPEDPLSPVTHYGQSLMRPARSQRVSVIHLSHTLLNSLRTATTVSAIRVTKASQSVQVARRSRRQYGIWESASGPTHARVHEDHLPLFTQVNNRSTQRSYLLCTPSLLFVEFVRICLSLGPLEVFSGHRR